MAATSSNEFSTNGDCSLKIIKETIGYSHIRFGEFNGVANETFHGTIDILNNSSMGVYLRLIESETNQHTDISIPYNESVQKISISHTITDTSTLEFNLILRNLTDINIDNITLTIQ